MGTPLNLKVFSDLVNRSQISCVSKGEEDQLYNLDGSEYYSRSPEMFFQDGKRRIDFVLVYKRDDFNEDAKAKRFAFLSALANQMIEIEVENCQGEILARTGPQTAGFKDEAAYQLDQVEQSPEDVEDYARFAFNDGGDDGTPLEDAILTLQSYVFVKLHASWSTLIRVAEVLHFRKPLKQAKIERLQLHKTSKLSKCFELDPKNIFELPEPYRAPFSRTRMDLFEIPENYEDFFTPTERSLVVDYVLKRTGVCPRTPGPWATAEGDNTESGGPKYMTEEELEFEKQTQAKPYDVKLAETGKVDLGIDHMISEKVFIAAYPLHEPSAELLELLKSKGEVSPSSSTAPHTDVVENNMRTLLSNQWGSLRMMLKFQPLDYVRLYFGESVAFYFAWIGLYTYWLIPVGIFGLLVFCLSAIDISDDYIVEDVCLHGGETVMCPPCNRGCQLWLLNTSCFATKMTHLVDNIGTVLFAVFMAIWATLFMEHWKRYQNVLSHRWNVQHIEPVDEPPRPEFLALLKKRGYKSTINLATGREEPLIPFWSRKLPVLALSYTSVFFGVLLCLAALVGVIFYRLVVVTLLKQDDNDFVNSVAGMITTVTSSCINLVFIYILKFVYDKIAVKMTDMENHRTQSEYDNSLTLKLYLLQFVNYYSSIFYIAFIQGTTAGVPGDDSVPIRSTGCDNGNCLFQLFIQLAIIMVGKQLLNFVTENTLPPIKRCLAVYFAQRRAKKERSKTTGQPPQPIYGSIKTGTAEKAPLKGKDRPILYNCRINYTLLDGGSRPLFEEYLEMLIQYGFITMFVPAFPIAPLFALLNNMFELRTDAKKFLRLLRRPVVKRQNGIGIWYSILSVVSSLAIRTNACLIAFTSEYLERMVYKYYYSPNRSLEGFVNFTLSYMNVSRFKLSPEDEALLNNSIYCRYRDYREPPTAPDPYAYTPVYWHILAVKFAFVLIFENIAILLTGLIAKCIPDMPSSLRIISRHEMKVINELIVQVEVDDAKDEKSWEPPTQQPPIGFTCVEGFKPELCSYTEVGFTPNQ